MVKKWQAEFKQPRDCFERCFSSKKAYHYYQEIINKIYDMLQSRLALPRNVFINNHLEMTKVSAQQLQKPFGTEQDGMQ